ncbi:MULTISPECIES: MarR family winged helix-turn-helix transcriptional regulator [unclassified Cryobacterium]|uniref:MarR family winged helix-turn-helix transcriptional regulator n=1 Tax=unclassified Cryobacterium TaxID=2649013 RepID=UPI00106AD842|nr:MULTISPECIES: MarR family transcriptional regulator [unclassified Cryobacterium]MDY7528220.1 MarR family transcriptional regulator [Cryobacterium sp. 10C2]MDY7556035.1 MarR family transcriptional regulator [Cryobacterium sp. 10C3]MEB0286975.1 MarR family transcriptional regulator [Cryobacterium sp. 10S3]MEB0289281.1 MarR family transcriptional regulator [Cryobacterium sp. 10C2]MEB0304953.1 MarR family transcriptional regulator [Cryobacterium sp. 10I1]
MDVLTEADARAADATLAASRALLGVVARSVVATLDVVSLPQFRVLVLLSSTGPTRMGAVAERMGVIPSTFSRFVDRMVAGGWVERAASPDSRREVLLELTESGRRLVDDATGRRRSDISTILSRMTPDRRTVLQHALQAFADAAGEPQAADLLTLGL